MDFAKGQKHYEAAWSLFLSQAGKFYAKLEQGSKPCGQSQAWFGQRKRERREDPLLSYIQHARNSDEHSLDLITGRSADGVEIKFPESSEVRVSAWVRLREDGKLDIANPTVSASGGDVISVLEANPRLVLLPVDDRGVRYQPPALHLGKSIYDDSPVGIASLAATYFEAMLAEASQLPKQG